MENLLLLSVLFDYYGGLLRENQQAVCDMYYNQNLSLAEIAMNLDISRQGVHETLKKAEHALKHYEETLHLYEKNTRLTAILEEVNALLQESALSDYKKRRLAELTEQIGQLI